MSISSSPSLFMSHLINADKWDSFWINTLRDGLSDPKWDVDFQETYKGKTFLKTMLSNYVFNPQRQVDGEDSFCLFWDALFERGLTNQLSEKEQSLIQQAFIKSSFGKSWGTIQRLYNLSYQDAFDEIAHQALENMQKGGRNTLIKIKKLHPDGWNYQTNYGVDLGVYVMCMANISRTQGWVCSSTKSGTADWMKERLEQIQQLALDWEKANYTNPIAHNLLTMAHVSIFDQKNIDFRATMANIREEEDEKKITKPKPILVKDPKQDLVNIVQEVLSHDLPRDWMKKHVQWLAFNSLTKQPYDYQNPIIWPLLIDVFSATHHILDQGLDDFTAGSLRHLNKWTAPLQMDEVTSMSTWNTPNLGAGLTLLALIQTSQQEEAKEHQISTERLQRLSHQWFASSPGVLGDQTLTRWLFSDKPNYTTQEMLKKPEVRAFLGQLELSVATPALTAPKKSYRL